MIAIAKLTIREAARRRILRVLVGLSVGSVVLVALGVRQLVTIATDQQTPFSQIQFGVSQVLILVAFMFSFILAMTAAFLGAPAIASDLESGIALAVFARPLRRGSYVIGRWLGLCAVIVLYATASGLLAIGAVGVVSGYVPPSPVLPIAYLAAQAATLMTVTLLLSTRLGPIASGAVAVVIYGMAWMAGVLGGVGTAFGADTLARAASALGFLLPSDGLWRGVVYGLEPPIVIAILGGGRAAAANPFFAEAPPSAGFIAWVVAWFALVLGLTILSLRGREI